MARAGRIAVGVALAIAVVWVAVGRHPDRGAGAIEGARRPPSTTPAAATQEPGAPGKSILFGDLHVHTTFSIDAFAFSLPLLGGTGAHPPADACDFARYCSELDFFSLNDHAEGLFPQRWAETKESVRECNARAGDPASPDLVAFVGWEWTQVGATPATHYGHRNVVFLGQAEDEVPKRPISALPPGAAANAGWIGSLALLGPLGLGPYADFLWHVGEVARLRDCPTGVDTRELPADCRENASTPAELLAKLGQWGYPSMVIPHGLAWGAHAPPGARLDLSLAGGNYDPRRERLVEIFSGHGNSEEFRDRPGAEGADGEPVCAAPTKDFLPCCWRAGEIVRARCGDLPEAECEKRVEEARRLALAAGVHPERVLPDTTAEDWLDCDQCRDGFKPVMSPRPQQTAQYGLAIRNFAAAGDEPDRFRWGFIASSDDHAARAGTGYKQVMRRVMTDARGFTSPSVESIARRATQTPQLDPRRAQPVPVSAERSFGELFDFERGASFFYPGGLVAAHASGRSREAIWDALQRREVYATSGPRILLWFDLVNGPDGRAPMGSAVSMAKPPAFEVRAAGAFVQRPGCPPESRSGLSPERLDHLCRGECYFPSEERERIAAIEVVRVRPQARPGEPIAPLIEDPWRRFACPADPAGCRVAFEDPDYATSGRDAVYYVRALQEPTPAINGANLRTVFDADGNPLRVEPCSGSWRTPESDDCLAPVQERAWSSPIYVDQPPAS
ncbi:MAG TPA: DUF3604 domain-containing protein [Myxococcota bacterium]|nr:DUF3604 domain-containing protein [Myxococcota bacterium]